jgi:hypothetical protein
MEKGQMICDELKLEGFPDCDFTIHKGRLFIFIRRGIVLAHTHDEEKNDEIFHCWESVVPSHRDIMKQCINPKHKLNFFTNK